MNDIFSLLEQLVRCKSVTPQDAGCLDIIINYLEPLGFSCIRYDNHPVSNLYAYRGQSKQPSLMFAGHTDVVPSGCLSQWSTSPFELTQDGSTLYGRGTADMKGSLACMLVAIKEFIKAYPEHNGSIHFLITSGEEGDDFDKGTPFVMSQLKSKHIIPDYCIVGEPSSSERIADVIKIGRRGSLTGKLIIKGKQGHVAYPHLATNPIHIANKAMQALIDKQWDEGNDFFPPTSFQITYINAGGEANNIIPGILEIHFNFRFSSELSSSKIQDMVTDCLDAHELTFDLQWRLNGEPFITQESNLLSATIDAIKKTTKKNPILSTAGGTSDGRFIAPYGTDVLELGPINATIHQANENTCLEDLNVLSDIYFNICQTLLVTDNHS